MDKRAAVWAFIAWSAWGCGDINVSPTEGGDTQQATVDSGSEQLDSGLIDAVESTEDTVDSRADTAAPDTSSRETDARGGVDNDVEADVEQEPDSEQETDAEEETDIGDEVECPESCDPLDPCTECVNGECVNADASTSCDDGDPCTMGDTCSEGTCEGTPIACDDQLECTLDECVEGKCQYTPEEACVIDGVCVAADTVNPDEQCAICSPKDSTDDWSNRAEHNCSDGNPCTLDAVCLEKKCEKTVANPVTFIDDGTYFDEATYLLDIVPASDDGFIIVGATYADGVPDGLLLKVDQLGSVEYAKRLGKETYTNIDGVAPIGAGQQYVAVGVQGTGESASGYYQIFDESLEITAGGAGALGSGQINAIAPLPNGKAMLVGSSANISSQGGIRGRLILMDTDGSVESNTLHQQHATAHSDVVVTANNAAWVIGHRDPAQDGVRQTFVRKSSDGIGLGTEQLWSPTSGSDRGFAGTVFQDKLIVGSRSEAGDAFLRRYDMSTATYEPGFVEIPESGCTTNDCDFRAYDMLAVDNRLLVAGLQDAGGERLGWIGAFDGALNLVWEYSFGESGLGASAEAMTVTDDGLIAVVGTITPEVGQPRRGYLFFINPAAEEDESPICGDSEPNE